MQSDRPLKQPKAAKASIKLRRLAPNRGIHRYPRDTERNKSTFLAKLGLQAKQYGLRIVRMERRKPSTRKKMCTFPAPAPLVG